MRETRITSMPGSRDAGVALAGPGPGPGPGPPAGVVIWPLSAASGSSLLLAFSSTGAILPIYQLTLPSFLNLALTQTEMGSKMHAFIITIY